jgi:hypothetical protein
MSYVLTLVGLLVLGGCKKKNDPIPLGPSFVTFVVEVPPNTPTNSELRVVGNQLGTPPYDPAKSTMLLKRETQGTYVGKYKGVFWTSSLPSGGLRFRFARGITNAFLEKARSAEGTCIDAPEREVPKQGAGGQVFEFKVEQWADLTANCN